MLLGDDPAERQKETAEGAVDVPSSKPGIVPVECV